MHHGHDSLSHRSHQHHPYVNSHGTTHALQHSSSGPGTYPHQAQASAAYLRRGSVEFGAGSDGSGSTADHSIPSSAASSNVHLPLDNLSMQQTHPLPYNVSAVIRLLFYAVLFCSFSPSLTYLVLSSSCSLLLTCLSTFTSNLDSGEHVGSSRQLRRRRWLK